MGVVDTFCFKFCVICYMIKMSKNKIIVWNVTTRCNQKCKFCFGPECGSIKNISTRDAKKKIEEFREQGVEKLVFTGGEPLLRNDILELIKYAKQKKIYTILHTNGLLLTVELIDKFEPYLDQINLPLDGYNEETNDKLRSKGHFIKVMNLMQLLKNIGIKIIISTVVTSENIDGIDKIAKVLPAWINKWRVFQVRDVDKGMAVSDEEFERLELGELPFRVQKVKREDKEFEESYEVV